MGLQKARDFFIHDITGNYQRNHCFFRSRVKAQCLSDSDSIPKNKSSGLYECLLLPLPQSKSNLRPVVGLALPQDISFHTHLVTKPSGEKVPVRLMIKVRERNDLVDPFDFRYGKVWSF